MGSGEMFRKASLVFAIGSTVLFWLVYLDNGRATAQRRAALAATTMPIPLNGFKPDLRGVVIGQGSAGQAELADRGHPRLLIVVSDTCPGCGVVVPEWVDWIRTSQSRDYSAAVVSLDGASYQSQIIDALASRRVDAVSFRVTQVEEFTLSSGVSFTPTLLAMDRRGYVRIVSGAFSQATRRALEAFLDSEGRALAINQGASK